MLRRFSIDFAIFSIVLDALFIALSLGLATYFRPGMSDLPYIKFIPNPLHAPVTLYFAFPILWVLVLYFFSVYDGRRNIRFWKELASLTLASLLAITALAGLLYLSYRDVSRLLFLTFVILAYLFIVSWRLVFRLAYRAGVLTNVQPRNILIIGTGEIGAELASRIHSYRHLGLNLVGYLYDQADNTSLTGQCLGGLKDARRVVENQHIHDLVIALPSHQNGDLLNIISDLQTLPIKIWLIPDYHNLSLYSTHIEELAGLPLVDLRAPALSEHQRLVKRSFDILLTLLFLPIGIIGMGLTALAVWIDTGQPILFRQVRVGENGRLFTINKFRTMKSLNGMESLPHNNPVSSEDPDHKVKDDPRVTRLGRLLRRTSLDELPQLINVLKGEMSLVGPRPEMPALVDQYQPWQYRRFSVPPGLTGWWQVSGRSDRPMHLHTQDDLYYIENYSVFLDLTIIARTVVAVLSGKGAY